MQRERELNEGWEGKSFLKNLINLRRTIMGEQLSGDWQDQIEISQEDSERLEKSKIEQKERFADAASVQSILESFKSVDDFETQEEFIEGFNEVRGQLKPYFEKYELPEPACFKDIAVGDNLWKIRYGIMEVGYGLLREKLSF